TDPFAHSENKQSWRQKRQFTDQSNFCRRKCGSSDWRRHPSGKSNPRSSASGTGPDTGRNTHGNLLRPTMSDRTISTASVKSGVVGFSPTTTTADHRPPSGPSPTAYRNVEGTPQHGNFDFERDRSVGSGDLGVGTGASTIAAEKAFKGHQGQEVTGTTGTSKTSSAPLSSGVANTAGTGSGLTGSSTGEREREFPLSGGTTTGIPATDRNKPGVASTLDSDAPRTNQTAGDGRAALAGAAGGALEHEHGGHGHSFEGDPCPPGEHATEGTPHFSTGPHVTDTANRLDPNLQSSNTSHPASSSRADPSSQSAHLQQPGQTIDPTSSDTQGTTGQHHYGRDAALAGAGATAAGGGAHALGSRDTQDTGPASRTIGPHKSDAANIADPRVQPEPEKMKNVGARDTNTGPASATIGPHESNLANVADPKVQPQPEKMKDTETTGPHRSDLMNRMDPRVDSSRKNVDSGATDAGKTATGATAGGIAGGDPNISSPYNIQPVDSRVDAHSGAQTQDKQHHYGRDAAVAGGATAAGAAGYGAYEANKKRDEPISSSQPSATGYGSQPSSTAQRATPSDPTTTYGNQPSASTQQARSSQPSTYGNQPNTTTEETSAGMPGAFPESTEQNKPHYGRDAAIAGGAAATGAGAYGAHEASRQKNSEPISSSQPSSTGYGSQPVPTTKEHSTVPSSQPATTGYGTQTSSTAQPASTVPSSTGNVRHNEEEKPHYGRDAAIAGGAAATGAGAYSAYEAGKPKSSEPISSSQPSGTGYGSQPGQAAEQPHTKSSSQTSGGPYSNQPTSTTVPSTQHSGTNYPSQTHPTGLDSGAVTSGPARVTERSEPTTGYGPQSTGYDGQQERQHHYGRDAAIAGGAGAAGVGAYEASKHTGDSHRDPRATGTGQSTQPATYGSQQQTTPSTGSVGQPITQSERGIASHAPQSRDYGNQQQPQHHLGRDAAIAGGVGAAGAGAYEAGKHSDRSDRGPPGSTTGYDTQRAEMHPTHTAPTAATGASGTTGTSSTATGMPTQSREEEPKQHHYGRDAAVAGGAGAVGAGAAHEYKQHEAEKQAKEAQAQAEKEAKQQQKELEKRQAQADKDLKAQEKENEKAAKKEQKEHDKAVAAAEKEHQKEAKKQEKEHDKAVTAAEEDHKKHSEKEVAAGAGGAAAAGGAAYAAEEEHKKHDDDEESDKQKKPGLLEKILHPRRSKEQSSTEEASEYHPESERIILDKAHEYDAQQKQHYHGAVATDESGRHRLHKDPPASHPASQQQSGIVTEPHTGLPMNVGKYGSGQGGTDGAVEQIHGYEGEGVGASAPRDQGVAEPHTGERGVGGAEQTRNLPERGI
ncbi:MAG: hypothetical protein Q9157_008534, partial [Trypethelium eluteriae]